MIKFLAGGALLGLILCFAFSAKLRARCTRLHQLAVAVPTLLLGLLLASLTGTYTALMLPGVGGIALGSGAGALAGMITWSVLGTIGVVTGGVGVAIGLAGMAATGAVLGGIGAAAGGFGIQQVAYYLVHPAFWVPLFFVGFYYLLGAAVTLIGRRRVARLRPPPAAD